MDTGGNLRIDREDTGEKTCTVYLRGELDLDTYDQLEHALATAMADGKVHITIDLGGMGFISSSGFGVFIEAAGTVQELGGSIRFVNPSSKARDVFRLLGILVEACDFD